MSAHGYVRYTHGCRCEVCRTAKSEYMRLRRAVARRAPDPENVQRHGTRAAYEEHGCRCEECTAARSASDARYWPRRAAIADAKRIRAAASAP